MTNPTGRGRSRHWMRLVLGLLLLALAVYGVYRQNQGDQERPADPPPRETAQDQDPRTRGSKEYELATRSPSEGEPGSPADRVTRANPTTTIVRGQTIYNLDGEVTYKGDVDLTATLARIKAGNLLRFSNDGSTFQNRERRLPRQAAGYYKEYVHATPGLSGPGPQRVVMGQEGEVYYTPDHYESFQRVDE